MKESSALPMRFYRDPAEVVERAQMVELGCRACNSHTHLLGKIVCTDPRKLDNKGVPGIGHRCKWFSEGI